MLYFQKTRCISAVFSVSPALGWPFYRHPGHLVSLITIIMKSIELFSKQFHPVGEIFFPHSSSPSQCENGETELTEKGWEGERERENRRNNIRVESVPTEFLSWKISPGHRAELQNPTNARRSSIVIQVLIQYLITTFRRITLPALEIPFVNSNTFLAGYFFLFFFFNPHSTADSRT